VPWRQRLARAVTRQRLLRLGTALLCAAALAGGVLLLRRPAYDFLARRELAEAVHLLAADDSGQAWAEAELRKALGWNPRLGEARRLLGGLELRKGRLEHAFLEFQSLTELEPTNADGWLGLAEVRAQAAQPEEAEAALDEVLALAPTRPGVRTQRAELRYRLGRHQGAYLDAKEVVQADKKDVRAWLVLVRTAAQVKGMPEAVAAAEEGITSTGGSPALVQELAALRAGGAKATPAGPRLREEAQDRAEKWPLALGALMRDLVNKMQHGDWASSEQLAASAASTYPGTLMGPWLEGVIELSRGRLEAAERHFLRTLEVSPRSHRALTNLVGVWWKAKGPRYAGDQLVALAEKDSGFEYPLPIAAHAYLEADQPPLAESTARLSFAAAKDSPLPYRDVASLYIELDRAGEAAAVCEEGLGRFPTDVELQVLKARASLLLGDREAAIRTYEEVLAKNGDQQGAAGALAPLLVESRTDEASHARALAIVRGLELDGPLEPEVLGAMGRVYLEVAKDVPRARAYLEVAVRGAPGDPTLHYLLARALLPDKSAQAVRELRAVLASGRTFPEEVEARRLLETLGAAAK
jgi:predicted Zn-dependent protease